jgi:SulP family sulfate permease
MIFNNFEHFYHYKNYNLYRKKYNKICFFSVLCSIASILFIKKTIELHSIELINNKHNTIHPDVPENISIYDINGPMFFGAAQNALKVLLNVNKDTNVVILNMQNVTMLDMTGIIALESIVENFKSKDKKLIFSGLNGRILKKLEKAKFGFEDSHLKHFDNLHDSISYSKSII